MNKAILKPEFYRVKENILRCTVSPGGAQQPVIIKARALENCGRYDGLGDFTVNGGVVEYAGKRLLELAELSLDKKDVVKYRLDGDKPVVRVLKTVDGERTVIDNLVSYTDRQAYTGTVSFKLEGGGIFGLGQDEAGVYNYRGKKRWLYQHNMMIPMPCFASSGGYGVLFDCASLMTFDDTGELTTITLDTVKQLDFYIVAGGTDAVSAGFRYLTGDATLIPKWAFGYIQSKEKYSTGDELVEIAQRYRDSGIPIDCVVQDWKTWRGDCWGQKTVDRARYPDLAAMKEKLHALNVHSIVSVWPNMAEGGENHAEFAEKGMLLGDYSTYDAFDGKAREVYWKQLDQELTSGFDGWWCDSTEPFTSPDWCGSRLLPEEKRYELVGGEHKKYIDPEYANYYATVHAKGIYENQRKAYPGRRMLNLTRSGYPGIQQYGAVLWAGDTSAHWQELKKEIAKGVNISASGMPYWTVDIGAFFTGSVNCWRKWCGDASAEPVWFWNGEYDEGVNDPAYCELYVRWLQFGCFLPLFRSHGTDTPREIWNFGKKGDMFYDAIEKYIKLRYRLLPHIYSSAAQAALEGGSMIKSLALEFPDDARAIESGDEYIFCDSFLVCPVTAPMYFSHDAGELTAKTRKCYLPEGCGWYDLWTGERFEGGQSVEMSADIMTLPVFVRAGSIVLTQRAVNSCFESAPLDITVYPGADAKRVYYDDDGVSYAYEKGECERLELRWTDATKAISIKELSQLRNGPLEFSVRCRDFLWNDAYDGGEIYVTLEEN